MLSWLHNVDHVLLFRPGADDYSSLLVTLGVLLNSNSHTLKARTLMKTQGERGVARGV